MPERPFDPTRLRDQPALTSSHGRSWLILGGLLTLISLGVLVPMAAMNMAPVGCRSPRRSSWWRSTSGWSSCASRRRPAGCAWACRDGLLAIAFVAVLAVVLVADFAVVA